MKIRILIPDAAAPDGDLGVLARLGADVELEPVAVRADDDPSTELGLTRVAIAVATAGVSAEADGCDAVVVDSIGDPGLYALRSRLSIPVVAAGQSAFALALNLGLRFAIVLDSPRWRYAVGRSLRLYELRDRCVSVAVGDAASTPADADVVVRWTEQLAPAVEAGAIPVVDARLAALQTAERLCRLGLAQSKAAFPAPHVRQDEKLAALLEG